MDKWYSDEMLWQDGTIFLYSKYNLNCLRAVLLIVASLVIFNSANVTL